MTEKQQWFGVFAQEEETCRTQDGFALDKRSLAQRLMQGGILSLPGKDGQEMPCERFYDDWHVYAVASGEETVYGLVKMREQEHDAQQGLIADGDEPGVTISFVGFDVEKLAACLREASAEGRRALAEEIDRVVSRRGVQHDARLKRYFADVRAQGAYCIAQQYILHAASFAKDGLLEAPQRYRQGSGGRRIARFMRNNDREAGYALCDGAKIRISDARKLTKQERYAILATHTANTSLNSFAAEVRMHAQFLLPVLKVRILGRSLYDSALRADMSIDGARSMWFAPYYYRFSACVRRQARMHGEC